MDKPYIVDFTPATKPTEKQMIKVPRPRPVMDTIQDLEALLIERHKQGYELDQVVNLTWEPSLGDYPGGLISVFKKRED